ncbi:hypothetical protein CEXT_794581 [Caerostris extrusa]|uniref:Uncharacterized protein n=1 Tax=Caerostris extrusa TaxID=172846 RepID=A0AAV4WNJ2_CAEEX|nr:hypothetical protein CEXT_794581 [Caerostris extrusa]
MQSSIGSRVAGIVLGPREEFVPGDPPTLARLGPVIEYLPLELKNDKNGLFCFVLLKALHVRCFRVI